MFQKINVFLKLCFYDFCVRQQTWRAQAAEQDAQDGPSQVQGRDTQLEQGQGGPQVND
jgi:hypothetical protein